MARSGSAATTHKATPAGRRAEAAQTDKDREQRRLILAARRVPVWQVSAVTVIRRLYDARPAGGDELHAYKAMRDTLAQVPPEVMHAAEMNMRAAGRKPAR